MAYLKSYDELTKWIYFWIEDDDLLKKCNTISNKVISDIKKSLIVSLSTKKSFKAEIKSHSDEFKDIYDKEIPKVDTNHTCLAVTSLDSSLKKDENYYRNVFLKECKYIEKKLVRHIYGNLSYFLLLISLMSVMKNRLSIYFNHSVFGIFMISQKLYLNLSKYVDKLLVGKTLINIRHFSRKYLALWMKVLDTSAENIRHFGRKY